MHIIYNGQGQVAVNAQKENFMDGAKRNRRVVRDFSRRNFVIFYLVLLLVPTTYLIWYYTSTIWNGFPVHESLGVGAPGSTANSQGTFFWHLLNAAWKASCRMLPYSIGQYLLGLECAFDQQFLWCSGSLLAGAILSVVLWVDLAVNHELNKEQKTLWTLLFLVGTFFGLLLPQVGYWYFYMWLEPDKQSDSSPVFSDALST